MSQIKILEQDDDSASGLYQTLRETRDEYHKASMAAAIAFDKAKRFPTDETIQEAILQQEAVIETMTAYLQARQTIVEYQHENNPKTRGE